MASAASSPPPVQLLPTLDHRLPAKLRRGRKVWPGVFSFSAAGGSLKGCHELLLPSLLAAASASSGESGGRLGRILCLAPRLCEPETLALDWSSVTIGEARSDEELLASVRLRVRSFYEFNQSYNIEVSNVAAASPLVFDYCLERRIRFEMAPLFDSYL